MAAKLDARGKLDGGLAIYQQIASDYPHSYVAS